jgi:hypothetical protein
MNLTLTIPESTQPPITVTVGGTTGGATELTSYVSQVAGLPDYPAAFPPDLTGVTPAAIGAMANTRHRGFTIHTVSGGGNYFVTNYEGKIELETSSFSTAIAYALNNDNSGYRKRIHLSGGAVGSIDEATRPIFIVDSPIVISSSVIITGDEDNATIVQAAANFSGSYMFNCGTSGFLGSYVVFRGIRFDGNVANQTGAVGGINFEAVGQPKILNCAFVNFSGIEALFNAAAGTVFSARVSNCEFQTVAAGSVGIQANRVADLIVTNNIFRIDHAGGTAVHGIKLGANANCVTISNNTFRRGGGPHISVLVESGGQGLVISGNTFTGYSASGNNVSPVQFTASSAHNYNAMISGNNGPATLNNSIAALISLTENSKGVSIGPNASGGFASLFTTGADLARWLSGPATIPNPDEIFLHKSTSEVRYTTTYADDAVLVCNLTVGLWVVEYFLHSDTENASTAVGMKAQLAASGGLVVSGKSKIIGYLGSGTGTPATINAIGIPAGGVSFAMPAAFFAANNRIKVINIKAFVDVTTAGTMALQWAQNTVSATDGAIMSSGSYLFAKKFG